MFVVTRNGPPGYTVWRNCTLESILGLLKSLKFGLRFIDIWLGVLVWGGGEREGSMCGSGASSSVYITVQ